jgi:poly(3-hydroxyalkanoate) synthetase
VTGQDPAQVPARKPKNAIEDAPGSYVKVMAQD